MRKHERQIDFSPTGEDWRIGCKCGWEGATKMRDHEDLPSIEAALEQMFKQHLPIEERQVELLVDQRMIEEDGNPVIRGIFIMPEGIQTMLTRWYENEGMAYGVIPSGQTFPIGEIRTNEGHVFKTD